MPELPEVEKVRLDLEKGWAPESVIKSVKLFRKDLRFPLPSAKRCSSLYGLSPLSFQRRGKFLVLEFPSAFILSHLGMSGSWSWRTAKKPRRTHDHIQIDLSDGSGLIYNDPRRFGFFEILSKKEFEKKASLMGLGPDPLTDKLDAKKFLARYQNSRRNIKSLLMDQKVIAGVGNIYASEALFQAGISPERKASEMTLSDWQKLLRSVPKILKAAVKSGGTTLRDFVHANGDKGSFQRKLKVYGHEGEPCPGCGQPIVVKVLGGRSTYWCQRCQK